MFDFLSNVNLLQKTFPTIKHELILAIFVAVGAGALEDGLYDDVEPVLDEELGQAKVGDERTEIILAATFLLIVILSFIA